jgi:hypothetical protein
MTVLKLADRRDLRFAQLLGAQFGFGAASDVIDQLATQLSAFRLEREQLIAELQARFDEQIATLRAHFAHEVDALQAELQASRRAYVELKTLSELWPGEQVPVQ